jgi:hypothetical protein
MAFSGQSRWNPAGRHTGHCPRKHHPASSASFGLLSAYYFFGTTVSTTFYLTGQGGTPITNLKQANNTYAVNGNISKVWGYHTVKAGLDSASNSQCSERHCTS